MSVRRRMLWAAMAMALLCAAVAAHQVFDVRTGYLPPVPELAILAPADCASFEPMQLSGTVWDREKTLLLASNDVLRFPACGSGTLELEVRGSAVGGVGAYMVVSSPGGNLWEGEVTDPVRLSLKVPGAGWVGVAFLNDKYEPPADRNLWIESLTFQPSAVPGGG